MNIEEIQYIDIKLVEENNIKSLDTFKVNIIDLNNIWRCKESNISNIESINLYKLLGVMVENSEKTKIIIVFPLNQKYYYDYSYVTRYGHKYTKTKELKEIIDKLEKELENIFGKKQMIYDNLYYENTETQIKDSKIESSFYFKGTRYNSLITSIGSNKITGIKNGNLLLTTLKITKENMLSFIEKCYPEFFQEVEIIPDWFSSIEYFDDKDNKLEIEKQEKKISDLTKIIKEKQEKIKKNNYFKSVLYSTGDLLVEVVFKMLEEMLQYNLSDFDDKNQEDFLIKLDEITFVGEIKGVSKSIKSANIAQTEKHLRCYLDDFAYEQEKAKGILIINPQRTKALNKREKIHNNEKSLAKRYGILVILTEDLLKVYEKFINGEISTNEIVKILTLEEGFFSLDMLKE